MPAADHQAKAELQQEQERHGLQQTTHDDQQVDGAGADVALLNRNEHRAPHGEALDEAECGQPDQRLSEPQACGATALQPDGESE